MALLRCLLARNQCNTKKLGFLSSHLIRHHPIPSSSFFTTTTLPAERSLDEHHRRGIHTSITNRHPAIDSTTTTEEEHCLETLGGGGFREKQGFEMSPRVIALAKFAAFAIGDAQNLNVEFKRVVSAKVQLLNNGRLYSITIESTVLLVGFVKKFYQVHLLDSLLECNTVTLKEWCEVNNIHESSF